MGVKSKMTWVSVGTGLLWAIALSACGMFPAAPMDKKGSVDSNVMQSLQRQVRERDKRIAELESQLEALKVIDQDVEKRRKSSRPPSTATPASTEDLP